LPGSQPGAPFEPPELNPAGQWICDGANAVTCQNNCPARLPICCHQGVGLVCTPTDQAASTSAGKRDARAFPVASIHGLSWDSP
jgi:hypothetical protein